MIVAKTDNESEATFDLNAEEVTKQAI